MEVVASLSQGRTAAAQCGLFTYKSVPIIFEPPCKSNYCWFTPGSSQNSVFCLVALPQPFSFHFDASHALFVSIVLHCSLCVIPDLEMN